MFSEDIPKCQYPRKGPTGRCTEPTSQNSEKTWEMMVNPDVDGYTEILNTPKDAKTKQPTEKKEC